MGQGFGEQNVEAVLGIVVLVAIPIGAREFNEFKSGIYSSDWQMLQTCKHVQIPSCSLMVVPEVFRVLETHSAPKRPMLPAHPTFL